VLSRYFRILSSSLAAAALSVVLTSAVHAEATASANASQLAQLLPALKGKVILLDFWASWCGPCRQSFPWMGELQKRYGGANFVVVAVNLDQDRNLADQFLAATPAGFRVEYDPQGVLASRFDVTSMPTSVLIDRNGQVRERHKGFRQAQLEARELSLSKLLKE
jgi:cytochrome c biogenesis protein CcmG/thiol:disulfide interchange protein DsbE